MEITEDGRVRAELPRMEVGQGFGWEQLFDDAVEVRRADEWSVRRGRLVDAHEHKGRDETDRGLGDGRAVRRRVGPRSRRATRR